VEEHEDLFGDIASQGIATESLKIGLQVAVAAGDLVEKAGSERTAGARRGARHLRKQELGVVRQDLPGLKIDPPAGVFRRIGWASHWEVRVATRGS